MNRRIPSRYTILISCTGKEPLVLSFCPRAIFVSLSLALALPAVLLSAVFWSYAERNTELTQRNAQLTQEAGSILKQLETLESTIGLLKDRQERSRRVTGTARSGAAADSEFVNSQIGRSLNFQTQLPAQAASETLSETLSETKPETMLSVARSRIPGLLQLLQTKAEPISEQTLMREAARPKGAPLSRAKISSPFGLRPSQTSSGYELHQGIDFQAAYGSPVYSTAPGTIEKAGWDPSFGNRVVVSHGYGHRTLYAHLSELVVTEGAQLDRHQVIGYLGNTGRSNGPHLHYGVYRNGAVVDPKDYLN